MWPLGHGVPAPTLVSELLGDREQNCKRYAGSAPGPRDQSFIDTGLTGQRREQVDMSRSRSRDRLLVRVVIAHSGFRLPGVLCPHGAWIASTLP